MQEANEEKMRFALALRSAGVTDQDVLKVMEGAGPKFPLQSSRSRSWVWLSNRNFGSPQPPGLFIGAAQTDDRSRPSASGAIGRYKCYS